MDVTMLASFIDELRKIAANTAAPEVSVAKPAQLTFGSKPSSAMKTEVKPTDYSKVNTEPREAGYGTSMGLKSVPPPPIRA